MIIEQKSLRAALVLFLSAASCNLVGGIYEGQSREGAPCSTLVDCEILASSCPAAADCGGESCGFTFGDCELLGSCRTAVACESGACVFKDSIEGTPLDSQTSGDCAALVCDGKGGILSIPAATDTFDDGNACTVDACDGATPVHAPLPFISCYTGPPDTRSKGICKDGVQACDALGNPTGSCQGEVLPEENETCLSAFDDNCNGEINEGGDDCSCGDGFVSEGEACDDGDADSLDECNALCQPSGCGDGFLQPGEECDDANSDPGDACSADCKRRIVQVSTGGSHNCALLRDGQVKCWGYNKWGQLGNGKGTDNQGDKPGEMGSALTAVDLGMSGEATMIAAGSHHTCALLKGGSIKCWGMNLDGSLGLGDTNDRGSMASQMGDALPAVDLGSGAVVAAIFAHSGASCALLADGSLKCWGDNSYGRLGTGDTLDRGDEPGEMGDALPAVDLGAGKKAVSLAMGYGFTCALLDGGSVKCWGKNGDGQLGLGDKQDRGDQPGEMGDALPTVDLGTGQTATAISAGTHSVCAVLKDGGVKCWGGNNVGELGLGDVVPRGGFPGQMGDALPLVPIGKNAIAISQYYQITCVQLKGGGVKCWGIGGALGLGHTEHIGDNIGEVGALPAIDLGTSKTAFYVDATCAILNDGALKCWGINKFGQLGLGNTSIRGDKPGEMGDNLPEVKLW